MRDPAVQEPAGQRSERRVVVLMSFSAAVFVLLSLMVSFGLSDRLDSLVLLLFRDAKGHSIGPAWLSEAVADVTALGSYSVIVLAALFTTGMLLCKNQYAAVLFMLFALVGGSLASTGLKLLFTRGRPDIVAHLDQTFTSSFPSAHAMVSMLAWLTLAAIAVRFVDDRRLGRLIVGAAVLLSVLIGLSRVYLGVHWPSDVLAGWFAGLAWACACWLLARRGIKRSRQKRDSALAVSDEPGDRST